MHARVTTLQGSPEAVDEGIQRYRDTLSRFRSIEGNAGAVLLVDRASGKAVGITLWDSEDAMTASREQADQMRQQTAQQAGADIRCVDEYEVAVWET